MRFKIINGDILRKMPENLKINPSPSFGKFLKITGSSKDIKHFRNKLKEKNGDFLTLGVNQPDKKKFLYIISKKDFDKFINLMNKIHFFELRTNLEKYMNKKPSVIDVQKAQKQLKNNKFKI